jgi:two-component system phosphate regulon response regulator PhoB
MNEDRASTAPDESAKIRVLLVDDEPDLRSLFLFNFTESGFDAQAVGTAEEAFQAIAERRPDAIVLDVMLPDITGTEICHKLREDSSYSDVAILMLTARGDEEDRIAGFEAGADDYVIKPFSVRELIMRVRAVLRRTRERSVARKVVDDGTRLTWRGLTLDPGRHLVYLDGAEVPLRPLEFKLICTFMEHRDRTFTRRDLLREVWGMSGDIHTRTVDTHVRRLRERLGTYGDAVETVHSVGYRLRRA